MRVMEATTKGAIMFLAAASPARERPPLSFWFSLSTGSNSEVDVTMGSDNISRTEHERGF